MTDEIETPKKAKDGSTRGRPTIPDEEKIHHKFHLILMKAEMNLLKVAAKLEKAPSVAFFLRTAIEAAEEHPSTFAKHIPKGLAPASDDEPKTHYLLQMSAENRAVVDRVENRGRCEFIRRAALGRAFSIKNRNEAFDAAVEELKLAKKGAK